MNRMISMYLPGDVEAANAGDPNAQSRIHQLTQQMYSSPYGAALMNPHSPDPSSMSRMAMAGGLHPPSSAYPV